MTNSVVSAAPARDAAFHLDVQLDHPIDQVWAALTRKQIIDKYYFVPVNADIAHVGAEIAYGPPGTTMIAGVVRDIAAPRLLVHTFRFDSDPIGTDTVVTYRLVEAGKGVRLEIVHAGYAVDSQGYADIAGGWPIIAERLKATLDRR